tara:strand:- start:4578 stop:5099 length:522 start_codon:yes stop_codon:yes gene_type:complete
MKLNALYILLIILASLLLCNCLGKSLYEGMDNKTYNSYDNYYDDIKKQHNAVDTSNNIDSGDDNFDRGKNLAYGSLLATADNNNKLNSLDNKNSTFPKGDEDLYMLKSEMVPPVCPACPEVKACPSKESCPPCPPCARCPEPSFECKKVPNYSSKHNDSLPRPVLADFSQFGM